ncbi:MAG: hydrogenase maturation nickel metallochaperone HypA [Chloroflexi bacterium]|nr:hydrogenase maturation nickel metallochaperone HypA [Chloroflexota bacterium]
MHEVAAVSALVDALLEAAAPHAPYRADRVRVRLGSAFSEDALYQAFEMLTESTPLRDVPLLVERTNHTIDCRCGLEQVIRADDLAGHMWVCSNCGHVEEVADEDDLMLLGFDLTPLGQPATAGGR